MMGVNDLDKIFYEWQKTGTCKQKIRDRAGPTGV